MIFGEVIVPITGPLGYKNMEVQTRNFGFFFIFYIFVEVEIRQAMPPTKKPQLDSAGQGLKSVKI